jgi:hypothetical protein
MTRNYKKWLILAPLGLIFIGFGLSVTLEAANLKQSGDSFGKWFGYGTLGLIFLNAGLSIFGQSIIHKVKDDLSKEKR